MPTGEDIPRQRATSPSEQSSSSWSWISSTAPIAGSRPGTESTPAEATPTRIITAGPGFGLSPARSSHRVRCGETRRMYSRPPQCSPLLRAKMLGGWVAARSSATDGLGERADTLPHPLLVEGEVLEHGVAVGTGRGRVAHRRRELVGRQPEVGDGARQAVVGEACVERTEQLGVVAQERREEA